VPVLRRVLERAPDDDTALRAFVGAELACGRSPAAEAACRARLVRDPDSAAAAFLAGLVREEAGDDAGAKEAYRAALARNPDDWASCARLAELLLRLGDAAGAADVSDAGLAADPACLPLR